MCRFCGEKEGTIIMRIGIHGRIKIKDDNKEGLPRRIYQTESSDRRRKKKNPTGMFEETFIVEETYETKVIKKSSACQRFYQADDFLDINRIGIYKRVYTNDSRIDVSDSENVKSLTLSHLLLRESIPYLEKLEEAVLNNVSIHIPKYCFNVNLTGSLTLYEIQDKSIRMISVNLKAFSNSCKALLVLIKAKFPIDIVRLLKSYILLPISIHNLPLTRH